MKGCILALVLVLLPGPAYAQAAGATAKPNPPAANPTAKPTSDQAGAKPPATPPAPPPAAPRVTAIVGIGKEDHVQLKDVLTLTVDNLQAWRKANADKALHLYIAGTELANVKLDFTDVPGPNGGVTVTALLEVSDGDKDTRRAWIRSLQAAKEGRVFVSIGPTGAPFASDAEMEFKVYPWYRPIVWGFVALLVLLIIILGKKSNMLRDGGDGSPWSLARHQMAVWFVVVVGSYLYVWMITGLFSSISTTALTLIGISGATGLVALTMDNSKRDEELKTRVAREAERDALDRELNDPGGLQAQLAAAVQGSAESVQILATIATKRTRLEELKGLIKAMPSGTAKNDHWLRDLLSDETGVSFHRLQMAAWTIVLAAVFIRAVAADVLMPDFDPTLLGLLGISSGTYLGFKFPEKS